MYRQHLFSGMLSFIESSLPDMCLLNKQLWSQIEAACLTHSEFHPQTESHGSLWSFRHLTGTCIGTVPPLVVMRIVRDRGFVSSYMNRNAIFWPTLCKAYSRDPGVERGSVWLQIEGVQVCLGTLLCHEVQLGALTWLQHVREEKLITL